MPDSSNQFSPVPEYTAPGVAQNLPPAAALSTPIQQQPAVMPPLPPGVTRPVVTAPWSFPKRLGIASVLVLIGAALGWLTVWSPLQDAANGKAPSYSIKGLLLTVGIFYFALLALVADIRDHTMREIGPNGKPKLKPKAWFIFGGLFVAFGIGLYAFNYAMGLYGYTMF